MAIQSPYDINNLSRQQISELAYKARQREAGEGMSEFNTALDQIRQEELALIRKSTDQTVLDAFSKTGIEGNQNDKFYYTPIAAINAYLAQQSGAKDDYSQISTDYNKYAIENQGQVQSEIVAQRLSLPAQGRIVGSGTSFTDKQRKVDITAPPGTYVVEYENGAIEFRKIPASGRIPTPSEVAASGRAGADVGAVGKEVARTGETLFNAKSGADVKAPDGQYVIEYADGTYEFRPKPSGGYIPQPSQFNMGGDSSGAKPTTEAGKTLEELKAAQGLNVNGSKIQDPNAEQGGNGLLMSGQLELIGKEYTAANGQRRVAPAGQSFFQDPTTKTILLRPDSQAQYAKETTSPSVLAERQKAADSGSLGLPSIEGMLGNLGMQVDSNALQTSFQTSPIKSFQDLYTAILQQQGVPQIKAILDDIQKQNKELDAKFADDRALIDENPWLSENLRQRKQDALAEKYELKKGQLTAQLQLYESLQDDARQEAQFISSTALSQYNADRQFEFEQIQFAAQRAEAKLSAQIQLAGIQQSARQFEQSFGLQQQQFQYGIKSDDATRAMQERQFQEQIRQFNVTASRLGSSGGGSPYAGIREVQGGLYDLKTGQFIVQPSQNTNFTEQQLQTAFGQYASQNASLGTSALKAEAAKGGLDPESSFVKNTIDAVADGGGLFGKVRNFLGF